MSPPTMTIDMTDDLDIAPPVSKSNDSAQRTLLLAPASIATHEERLRDLFTIFNRSTTDLQMLDRLAAGLVSLPANTYGNVVVLASPDGKRQPESHLTRDVYAALVPSLESGAKIKTQDGSFDVSESREAVLAGLVEKDGGFEKLADEETVAIPLRLGAKKNGIQNGTQNGIGSSFDDLDNIGGDDDELIDENTLLSEEDMKRPIIQRKPA